MSTRFGWERRLLSFGYMRKGTFITGLACAGFIASSSATRADDTKHAVSAPAPAETAPRVKLPACAEPDAEGEFLSSTGCSGVFGVRGSATGAQGVSSAPSAGDSAANE